MIPIFDSFDGIKFIKNEPIHNANMTIKHIKSLYKEERDLFVGAPLEHEYSMTQKELETDRLQFVGIYERLKM